MARRLLIVLVLSGCATNRNGTPRWKTLPELTSMPKPDTSGLVPVNGIQLYYAIYNQQGKEPVLLLHGGLTSSDYWGMEILLLKKTHKVIIVDSRGHGRSTLSSQPLTYQLMASDVLLLMNDLKIQKASVVGWSDGGIIGLILAMQHPGRINKLFTYGANFSRSGEKEEAPDTAMSAFYPADQGRLQQDFSYPKWFSSAEESAF
jgi:pimeloyl-ACP methyl ester carboxylesterase